MERGNVVSVSWGDHLVFGEGAGRLATPADLARRMPAWRDLRGSYLTRPGAVARGDWRA